jgi:dTDP-4-amino-4,6-dideoxygalactose transaminase
LETSLAAYLGSARALAVANCDLALTLAVSALGLEPGTPVLLASYAFPSTLHAVLWNQLSPRFVDVSAASFCLDPEVVADELDERVALVLATHAFGAACELPALERLCERAGAALIIDGAQAPGTLLDGRHVASWGTATALSFVGCRCLWDRASPCSGLLIGRSRVPRASRAATDPADRGYVSWGARPTRFERSPSRTRRARGPRRPR